MPFNHTRVQLGAIRSLRAGRRHAGEAYQRVPRHVHARAHGRPELDISR